jgi:23S rRNA (cytosine1962-C5)-methyltransferase
MKQPRPYPRIIVTKKAGRSLLGGQPWVFEGEVREVLPCSSSGHPVENGDVVDVFEENGTWRGVGLISLKSKIRVRIVSRDPNVHIDEAFWERKLSWAWNYRKTVMGGQSLTETEPDTNCCRVLFSEADGFPGLIVDRYEDILVAQVGTVGMERLRSTLYPLLIQMLQQGGEGVTAIYERNDGPNRLKEGLPLYKGWWPMRTGCIQPSTHRTINESGIFYDVDFENSQKTGFFLDQKYNRRAVRQIASGRRVLDCFCHVGPFGLNAAAGGAAFIREVDISKTALELACKNARLNNILADHETSNERIGFTCANVFEYLPLLKHNRAYLQQQGGPFDLIVLDPPALTKSRKTISRAYKGYREINQAAMSLLPRGGYLATCSCSHFMTRTLLAKAIAEAARNANVSLRQVEEKQQSPDHPIVWGIPETHYLDFFIFQVV